MERHKHCPWCEQKIPDGFYEAKAARKGRHIKRVLKERQERGLSVGRPREHDYEKMRKLRSAGLSFGKIAKEMNCSTFTVFTACQETK